MPATSGAFFRNVIQPMFLRIQRQPEPLHILHLIVVSAARTVPASYVIAACIAFNFPLPKQVGQSSGNFGRIILISFIQRHLKFLNIQPAFIFSA